MLCFFRGCLAETALGERSLLVRSQYFVGGLEIAGTHLLGVGPAGIQDAWLGVRPESATEIIRSTHNIVIDWLTSYGILALCWITILVKLLWNAGKRLSIQDRSDKRQILAAGIGVAAIVLVVDAQIDLIMFDLGSTLFAFCLLGLAGAYTDIRTRRKGIDLCISVVPFVMASVIFYCGYAPLAHDESLQRNAAISMINGDQVAEVASILAEQSVTDQSTLIAVKLYMSVDDKNAATTILKDAIPTSSVWFMRSKAALLQKDAVFAAQKLVSIDPNGLQSALVLADAYWNSGDMVEAKQAYYRVLHLNHRYQNDPPRTLSKSRIVLINQRLVKSQ